MFEQIHCFFLVLIYLTKVEYWTNRPQLLFYIFSVKKVVEDVSRRPTPSYAHSLVLEVMATDANDEDVEIPYIKYDF